MAELTKHAQDVIEKRNISLHWIEAVCLSPQLVETDSVDITLEHRLSRIDENEGRVLRVIVNTTSYPEKIVTAYFDRGMKGKL